MAQQKTNVMRLLEQKKIKYTPHEYAHGEEAVDGVTVAQILNQDPERVFKTLVLRGASKKVYVFVVPVAMKLDYKKSAMAVGEKSVAMVHVNEINELTGYIRGGCSPLGMKKSYTTVYHETFCNYDTVMVSAGKIGYQVELSPDDLLAMTKGKLADIASEE